MITFKTHTSRTETELRQFLEKEMREKQANLDAKDEGMITYTYWEI